MAPLAAETLGRYSGILAAPGMPRFAPSRLVAAREPTYRGCVPQKGKLAERRRAEPGPDAVYAITGVRRGLSEDVGSRQRRYLISMAVRTVCLPLAVISDGWLRWAFLLGALLLPYIAVVIANGGREPTRDLPTTALYDPRRALEAAREEPKKGPSAA